MRYYSYIGEISCYGSRKSPSTGEKIMRVDLEDYENPDIAPTRLAVYGGMAEYIDDLHGTDEEERYIRCMYIYNHELVLAAIVVPAIEDGAEDFKHPAKVIAWDFCDPYDVDIFGNNHYISTAKPKKMTAEQYAAWLQYKRKYFN